MPFLHINEREKNITLHEIYTKLNKNLKGEEVSRSHEAL